MKLVRFVEGKTEKMDVSDETMYVEFKVEGDHTIQVSQDSSGRLVVRSSDGALSIRPQAANSVHVEVTDF